MVLSYAHWPFSIQAAVENLSDIKENNEEVF